MPRALATIERQPSRKAMAASSRSVTAMSGRTTPTASTAAPWRAVNPVNRPRVAWAARRLAVKVPGTIAGRHQPEAERGHGGRGRVALEQQRAAVGQHAGPGGVGQELTPG